MDVGYYYNIKIKSNKINKDKNNKNNIKKIDSCLNLEDMKRNVKKFFSIYSEIKILEGLESRKNHIYKLIF